MEKSRARKEDVFFDFDEDILHDLAMEGFSGQKLVSQFKRQKKEFAVAWDKLISEAENSAVLMTEEQLKRESGLRD